MTAPAQNRTRASNAYGSHLMNQLQALAMNEGRRWKKKLWSNQGRAVLEKLALAPWASRRRQELLELLDRHSRVARNRLLHHFPQAESKDRLAASF